MKLKLNSKLQRHARNFCISTIATFALVLGGKSAGNFLLARSSPNVQIAIAATRNLPGLQIKDDASDGPLEAEIVTGPWQQFSSDDLGFEVEFPPGDLSQERQVFDTHMGDLSVRTFSVDSGSRAYTVFYTAFPDYLAVIPVETTIESAIDGVLANVRRRTEPDRVLEMNGYPGHEMHYEGRDGLLYQHQIFVVDRHIFQVVAAAGDREDSFADDSERFFSSFEFLY
ncbi:MAG: hypothetical protein ACFB9N_11920 [Geitlerinemataceae cyanobacterium]